MLLSSLDNEYIEYDVPIKLDNKPEYWSPCALDWPRRWRESNYGDLIQYLIDWRLDNEKYPKYYDNAIKFAEWSLDHHDWDIDADKQAGFKYIKKYEPANL